MLRLLLTLQLEFQKDMDLLDSMMTQREPGTLLHLSNPFYFIYDIRTKRHFV